MDQWMDQWDLPREHYQEDHHQWVAVIWEALNPPEIPHEKAQVVVL